MHTGTEYSDALKREQEQKVKARARVKKQDDEKICDSESHQLGALPTVVEAPQE